jgi:hypothetical protein
MIQVECPFCKKMFMVRNNMMGKKVRASLVERGLCLEEVNPPSNNLHWHRNRPNLLLKINRTILPLKGKTDA